MEIIVFLHAIAMIGAIYQGMRWYHGIREVMANNAALWSHSVDLMDGVTFEVFLASLFDQLGWTVEPTPATGDFGADLIIARGNQKYAVQAKCYTRNVGVSAVQEAVSASAYYACTGAMVVTNSYFTKAAMEMAATVGVSLWDRDRLSEEIQNAKPPETEPSFQEVAPIVLQNPCVWCCILILVIGISSVICTNIEGYQFWAVIGLLPMYVLCKMATLTTYDQMKDELFR